VDLANPALLIICVLAAVAVTAWASFRAGRAAEPPRVTNEEVLEMLTAIHRRMERLEKHVDFMPRDFAEEANAARKLIDARLHEALDLLGRRLPAEERSWPQRSRAAGA
jgi:hypothetical protein